MNPGVPGAADVRPETRNAYQEHRAWISNGGGGFQQAPGSIHLLTQSRQCRTSAMNTDGSCALGGDEVVTTYDYGPQDGSAANNLLLRGTAVTAGGQTLRTCYRYDRLGRKISETAPEANLGVCP